MIFWIEVSQLPRESSIHFLPDDLHYLRWISQIERILGGEVDMYIKYDDGLRLTHKGEFVGRVRVTVDGCVKLYSFQHQALYAVCKQFLESINLADDFLYISEVEKRDVGTLAGIFLDSILLVQSARSFQGSGIRPLDQWKLPPGWEEDPIEFLNCEILQVIARNSYSGITSWRTSETVSMEYETALVIGTINGLIFRVIAISEQMPVNIKWTMSLILLEAMCIPVD